MHMRFGAALGLLALAGSTLASSLEVRDGKLAVSTIDGAIRLTKPFQSGLDVTTSISQPLALEADEVLRVSFRTFDPAIEQGEQQKAPQQVFAILADPVHPENQLSTPVPIKKSSGNRASFTLRLDRVPPVLLSGSGRLSLNILLGNRGASPLSYSLGEISVPAHILPAEGTALSSRDKQAREEGFYGWPAKHHTFSTPASETMPPAIVSIAFAALVLGLPWTVLVGLWGALGLKVTHDGEKPKYAFWGVIVYLELVALRYFVGGPSFTLFHMLPWLGAGGVAAVATGRYALGQLVYERLRATEAVAPAEPVVEKDELVEAAAPAS